MTRIYLILLAVFSFFLTGYSQANEIVWPDGQKLAVSLSYDDGLDSQLDNAIPALDELGLKASFYILPNLSLYNRMEEWKNISRNGHELGNHSMYHPCRRSLPDRDWVPQHHDLDNYTPEQMIEELTTANIFLKALDGKTERTITLPCGDLLVGNEELYIKHIRENFIAYKGQGVESGFSVIWAPSNVAGDELIEFVKNVPAETSLINILFHGVGGDHLSVSTEAHNKLLNFLAENTETYYIDTFMNIMKYANTHAD